MRIEGKLSKWNDDRGFGFILPTNGGQEIFAHISAFPNDGQRPKLGEVVTFEIEVNQSGKKKAVSISCPNRTTRPRNSQYKLEHSYRKSSLLSRLIPVTLVVLAVYGYGQYAEKSNGIIEPPNLDQISTESTYTAPSTPIRDVEVISERVPTTSINYKCDGRIYCTQMTSCEEATYFLKNCPGVKMDGGQSNGIPCESQWCK